MLAADRQDKVAARPGWQAIPAVRDGALQLDNQGQLVTSVATAKGALPVGCA